MLTNVDATTVCNSTVKKRNLENAQTVHSQPLATLRLDVLKKKQPKIRPSFFIGLLLMTMLISQYFYPVTPSALFSLQANELYKQLSGITILLFTLLQWRLTHHRNTNQNGKIKNSLKTHQWMGVIAPILIYLHTVETGYAYQSALLYSYIALVVIGLCNYHVFKIRQKWYISSWLTLHVSLATICLTLMGYHIYVAYTYS